MSAPLRIALLGTRGVPAQYGGFETCAEEVGRGLAARGHDVTVYSRRGNAPGDPTEYHGMTIRYTPHVEHQMLGTLTHTFTATLDALRRSFDVLVYFNAANALPALLGKALGGPPVALNVDGLEWRRRKWGALARAYYHLAEWLSTRVADRVVTDSRAIQAYYDRRWRTPSTYISYGAHVATAANPALLEPYGLKPDGYFLTVSRLEPENNADLTVQAFARVVTDKQLVIVGAMPGRRESAFARRLRRSADPRVRVLAAEYRPAQLRELFCGAYAYVHGNEVGGTNPALLQAMGYGCCVLALDVPFNAEVVGGGGGGTALMYRRDPEALAEQLRLALSDRLLVRRLGERARARVAAAYRWEDVVAGYERLVGMVQAGAYRARPPSDQADQGVSLVETETG